MSEEQLVLTEVKGHIGIMTFMLLIAVGQLILFKKMKWL